ncbi:MAG: transporter substrate-binding domain-containing protein [Calditrichaeota bacterium]|nr:transporter substrate-binding domain-containing protein [Calditrichota bacterium]
MNVLIYSLLLLFLGQPKQKEITVIFSGQQSKLVKYELQLIKELIDFYADEHNERIKIKYKGVKDDNSIYGLLEQGNPDQTLVINRLAVTSQKMASYDFSEPYFYNYYLLSSRKDFIFNPNAGKVKVGLLRSGRYKQIAKSIDKSFIKETVEYAKVDQAIDDLKARRIDLFLTDYVDLMNNDLKIAQSIDSRVEKLAIMFKKGSALKVSLDEALQAFKQTAQYEKLVKKHFGKYAGTALSSNVIPR